MKLPYLLPLLAVAAAHAEEKTDLATADAYRPQYDISPPPVITPQTPFGQPLENQFDYQRPWVNPSVAQNVSTNTTRPLQIEASIGNLGDQERLLYRQRGSNLYGATTKTAAASASMPATRATAKWRCSALCRTRGKNTAWASCATTSPTTNNRSTKWTPSKPNASW